nr:alpha/beta hydrolase-fold protein [Pseudemcibacter aquimaris]
MWLLCVLIFSIQFTHAEIRNISLKSEIFNNERMLRVYLPDGYDENRDAPYPVLYMNDGQNLYSASDSMTGKEWNMDETLDALIGHGDIPPMIVVGIDTPSYADRGNEYLPWPDKYLNPPIPEPMGKSYPDFLEKEVIPHVEQQFNVGKTPDDRALGGSSYGGLITMYTAVNKELFSSYLIESPSFYVKNRAIIRELRRKDVFGDKLYIGIGTHEGLASCEFEGNNEAVDDMRRAVETMDGDFELFDVVEECGFHSETAWSRRLPTALISLFGN